MAEEIKTEQQSKKPEDNVPTLEQYIQFIKSDEKLMHQISVVANINAIYHVLIKAGLTTEEELIQLNNSEEERVINKLAVQSRESAIKFFEDEPDAKDGE